MEEHATLCDLILEAVSISFHGLGAQMEVTRSLSLRKLVLVLQEKVGHDQPQDLTNMLTRPKAQSPIYSCTASAYLAPGSSKQPHHTTEVNLGMSGRILFHTSRASFCRK